MTTIDYTIRSSIKGGARTVSKPHLASYSATFCQQSQMYAVQFRPVFYRQVQQCEVHGQHFVK